MKPSELVVLAFVFLFVGCTNEVQQRRIEEFESKLKALEFQKGVMEDRLKNVEDSAKTNSLDFKTRLATLEFLDDLNKKPKFWATIDPTSKGYSQMDTDMGNFFISAESIEPYLDGFKINVEVGNPHFMTFSGFSLKANWNTTGKNDETKTKQEIFTDKLLPGKWNRINFIVTPCSAEEVRNLRIRIFPDQVMLSKEGKPTL